MSESKERDNNNILGIVVRKKHNRNKSTECPCATLAATMDG
jgi:hypothetical protein